MTRREGLVPVLRLEVVRGEPRGMVFDGHLEAAVTIGKAADNQVVLHDKTVSKYHAVIEPTGEGVRIQDRRSTNGTKRRGEPLPSEKWVALTDGDEIELGLTLIRVGVSLPAAAPPPPPARSEPVDLEARTRVLPAKGAPPPPRPRDEPPAARARVEPSRSRAARQKLPPEPEPLRPEHEVLETFGRFEVVASLGATGSARVDVAVDGRNGAHVTLTRLSGLGFFARRRFLAACEQGRGLEHEAVLGVVDVGREGDVCWVACGHLDGVTAEQLLRACGRSLTADIAIFAAREVSRALAYVADRRGPGFRPLVSDTLVVIGEGGRVALRDVGVPALDTGTEPSRFSSPEEEAGKPGDVRSAIFALGVLLYELLQRDRIVPEHRTTLPSVDTVRIDIPHDVADVTSRMLEVKPEQRYGAPADLERDLSDVLDGFAPGFGAAEAARWIEEHVSRGRRS